MKKTKLIKPTQYISKISIWKYNISFPLLFLLNVVLILLMLALPPSIFVPEVYVKSMQMPNLKIWERYVFFEISTFLISFSVAFIIFLFLNIKKAKKRGLVNLICLFIAFALIEFIYTGFFVSPHKCPESLIQTDYYKCGVGEITFGCYGPSEICIRVLNHIFIPFLFLPLIYGVSQAINQNKRVAVICKRTLTLFLGILTFGLIKQIIFLYLIKTFPSY